MEVLMKVGRSAVDEDERMTVFKVYINFQETDLRRGMPNEMDGIMVIEAFKELS